MRQISDHGRDLDLSYVRATKAREPATPEIFSTKIWPSNPVRSRECRLDEDLEHEGQRCRHGTRATSHGFRRSLCWQTRLSKHFSRFHRRVTAAHHCHCQSAYIQQKVQVGVLRLALQSYQAARGWDREINAINIEVYPPFRINCLQ